jgi:hypothetical protein
VGRDVEGFGPWDAGLNSAFSAGRGLEGGTTVESGKPCNLTLAILMTAFHRHQKVYSQDCHVVFNCQRSCEQIDYMTGGK